MPTQIVVDIDDPANLDAWGLRPVSGGVWVAGAYAKGSVAKYNGVVWLANVQTSATPGSNGDWIALISAPWSGPPVPWASSTVYTATAPASVVSRNGSTYVCVTSHTSTGTFDATKWSLLAQGGTTGPGVSAGGAAGQVLVKNSSTDYDTLWSNDPASPESTVASAATCDIGAATTRRVSISGTTTITSFGTAANRERLVRFAGALTLTHNGTSLSLPTGTNITTGIGDVGLFVSDGFGNFRCAFFQRADGTPLAGTGTAIRADIAQSLTSVQQMQALANIGALANAAVRQTVVCGPATTSGLPNFLPASTGALSLAAQNISGNPLCVTAANGAGATGGVNRTGAASALTWSSLTANSTLYVYVTVNADGTMTPGFTSLAPIYQPGGTPATTSGQFTFNIGEMRGYMGNGSSAPQAYIVFVGECVTGASTVTSGVAYAFNGTYDSGWTTALPTGSVVNRNHNLGIKPNRIDFIIECIAAEAGYAVGDQFLNPPLYDSNSDAAPPMSSDRNSVTSNFGVGYTSAFYIAQKASGGRFGVTNANWKYRHVVQRGW